MKQIDEDIDRIYNQHADGDFTIYTSTLKKNEVQRCVINTNLWNIEPDKKRHVNHNIRFKAYAISIITEMDKYEEVTFDLVGPKITLVKTLRNMGVDIRENNKSFIICFKFKSVHIYHAVYSKEAGSYANKLCE